MFGEYGINDSLKFGYEDEIGLILVRMSSAKV